MSARNVAANMICSNRKHWLLPPLLVLLSPAACGRFEDQSREEDQRELRARRLARARAQRAARARRERWRKQQMRPGGSYTTVVPPRRAPPSEPCNPAALLKQRAASAGHDDGFSRAVDRVLTAVKADLVELSGKPVQRFTFYVRMHPDEAPRFGRRRPAVLELELRHRKLCYAGRGLYTQATLRVALAKPNAAGTTASLWPHRESVRRARLPIGKPVQLLLDPMRHQLGPQVKPWGGTGLWEVRAARFAGRKRLARLSLPSSQLPDPLRQLHLIEEECSKPPDRRCRFLTRLQGRRARVTTFDEAVRLAAPIQTKARAMQLHEVLLSLRFPRCTGGADRRARGYRLHPCISNRKGRLACKYWRAFKGFGNEPQVVALGDRFVIRQILSCPGKTLRILQLQAAYLRKGKSRLRVTDLTPRASRLLQQVKDLERARYRRRRRRRR